VIPCGYVINIGTLAFAFPVRIAISARPDDEPPEP
jgi:hypothetical protein